VIRDFCEIRLGVVHEHEVRLATVDRIAESPASYRLVPVAAMAALGRRARKTGAALAAWSDGAHDDALPLRVTRDGRSNRFDDPDGLVSHHEPFPHRILALQDVNVRAANGRQRHAHQGLAWAGFGPRDLADANLVFALKDRRLHRFHGNLRSDF
jgi:hypothetical protein